jgi:hypothetical protein
VHGCLRVGEAGHGTGADAMRTPPPACPSCQEFDLYVRQEEEAADE